MIQIKFKISYKRVFRIQQYILLEKTFQILGKYFKYPIPNALFEILFMPAYYYGSLIKIMIKK